MNKTRIVNFMKDKTGIQSLVVLLLFFILLTAFWKNPYFPSDEEEIFVKGQQMAQGLYLYKDIGCQHMPLMYFLAAFFSFMGIQSITGFRLCFYFVFALVWATMYFAYSEHFGKKVLAMFPLVYMASIANLVYGTCVVGDQLQGQGITILFFELLLFSEKMEVKFKNCCMISLGIFISFASVFTSVFPIFFIAVTVFAMEMRSCCQIHKKVLEGFIYMIKKYWKLILTVAAPFVIMLGYFQMTHTLGYFYSWVYAINREVYPKYTTGYGTDILGGLFGGISGLGAAADAADAITLQNIRAIAMLLISILFLVDIVKEKKDRIFAAGIGLVLIGAATRGAFNSFHGVPVCALMSVITVLYILKLIPDLPRTYKQLVINITCIILFFSGYVSVLGNIFSVTTERIAWPWSEAYAQREMEDMIDVIAEDEERIGFTSLSYDILLNAHVTPASVVGGSCPWLWEWAGEQAMYELLNSPPRIFLFNRELNLSGYPLEDYAEELIEFVETNYVNFEEYGQPALYVRSDVYADVLPLIDEDYIYRTYENNMSWVLLGEKTEISQTFQAQEERVMQSISVKCGTFARVNDCTLQIYIQEDGHSEQILLGEISCLGFVDNEYAEIPINTFNLKKGTSYTVTLKIPDADENNCLALYEDVRGASDTTYASINGQKQIFNTGLKIQ